MVWQTDCVSMAYRKKKVKKMDINEIEPRFEELESRVVFLESTQKSVPKRVPEETKGVDEVSDDVSDEGTPETEEMDDDLDRFHRQAEADAMSAQSETALDPDLIALIEGDVKAYDANTVGQALLHKVCMRDGNRDFCRFEVMEIETGDIKRVQPFQLTDAKYNVLSRSALETVIEATAIDKIEWRAEEMDCEKIARKFVTVFGDLGIDSVGRVLAASGNHSFIIALVQDGASVDVVFVEPQTDAIVEPVSFDPATADANKYNMYNAFMIIS